MATYTVTTGNDTTAYTVSTGARGPAGSDANVTTASILAASGVVTNPTASVFVDPSGTDTDRGAALIAAYAAAKLLTPNGAALSATNRAVVIIPPGKYQLADTLTLDANFVDLLALVPEKGGERLPTDTDTEDPGGSNVNDFSTFRPSSTIVYSVFEAKSTVYQTATNVRLVGFTIASLCPTNWIDFTQLSGVGALFQGDIDATDSYYEKLYLWSSVTASLFSSACGAYRDFTGTWVECTGNSFSFIIGKGTWDESYSTTDADNGKFRATMIDCVAGSYSFVGDGVETGTPEAVGAKFYRCRAIGKLDSSTSGAGCFGSCGFLGSTIDSDCYFEECEAGERAFGIARTVSGTFVRCRAGQHSFAAAGGTFAGTAIDCEAGEGSFGAGGVFSGYARNCVAPIGSFGGRYAPNGWVDRGDSVYCSGTLVNCISEGAQLTRNLSGAEIRGCRFTTTANNINGIKLLDSTSSISNSDILVLQGGSGVPIYAATAKNVAAYHCRMNNASNDADGLHSNVTNLVATPNNVVSDSVT